jgi:hypothetical protein
MPGTKLLNNNITPQNLPWSVIIRKCRKKGDRTRDAMEMHRQIYKSDATCHSIQYQKREWVCGQVPNQKTKVGKKKGTAKPRSSM